MMGPTARLIEEKKPAEGQSDPATSDHGEGRHLAEVSSEHVPDPHTRPSGARPYRRPDRGNQVRR